jgi:hypothetical protein
MARGRDLSLAVLVLVLETRVLIDLHLLLILLITVLIALVDQQAVKSNEFTLRMNRKKLLKLPLP